MAQRPPTFLTPPETAEAGVRLAQVSDLAEPEVPVPADLVEPEKLADLLKFESPALPVDLPVESARSISILRNEAAAVAQGPLDPAALQVPLGQSPLSMPLVADLDEPDDLAPLPEIPLAGSGDQGEPAALAATGSDPGVPIVEVPETETTEALSIELVDAELDAFEVPSVFLDVPPIQVAMNDAVARDFGVGPIEAIEEEVEEETEEETDTTTTTITTTTTDDTDEDTDNGGGGGTSTAAVTPSMSIADVTTSDESAANATFTVTLSESTTNTITVDYASSNSTASAGSDYTATSGTLTISAGDTTGTFTVPVLSDATDENNETATLTLSSASNATISDATATLTITDDDDAPTISINDVTASDESAANSTFTATLSAASAKTITVDYASSNDSLSFTAADIATSADGAHDVHVADMDGDGDLDIVSASYADDTIAWYENDGASDPSFTAANIATSADRAHGVHVADMDGDGDLDIVSASGNDDAIAWYENDGAADPSWTAADIATSADYAYDVHVADMDGDGDLDIVSASRKDDTIAWYENDGTADPSWSAANIDTNADYARDVHVADLDGDGDLDIVSASSVDDTIAWYENDGAADPSWTAADIATSADYAFAVHVADMDGDGDLDILSASKNDDAIAWYENDGASEPTWSAADIATSADGASDVYVADLDMDGDLDIVSASSIDDTIAWYENDGAANPSWSAANIDTNADGARDVHVADLDGDGDLDIISASENDDTIAWYESNAADKNLDTDAVAGTDYTAASGTLTFDGGDTTATFTVPVLADSFPENNETATMTLSSASNATISDATGTLTITDDDSIGFTAANIATSADSAFDVHVADMDGDGDLDIVSASNNDDTIAWYENDGAANPSFTAADIYTDADGARGVYIADMDMDGDLDIVSCSAKDDTIRWHENDGAADPSWTTTVVNWSFADQPLDVHVADLDGDGDLDIVSASASDDTIGWYENDGAANPSWTTANIDTNADSATDVYVADLDGDGDLDIVSASQFDDTIAWYENDGAANPSWTAANIDTNADSAIDVHVADMDGDGDLDIVSASYEDDTIAWYENDGASDPSFTAADIVTNADGAEDVEVADLDGDGDLDIVSAVAIDNSIVWYENDGASDPSWTAATIDTNADAVRDVHVADLDGDGDLDIISASSNDDTIAWYENDCDGSDPLVLDLDGDGVELLGLGSGVTFDVDADGVLETTGWVGPDDGLLVMDLDGSGQIENMTEVFSEQFRSGGFATSLEALVSLNTNADRVIDAGDDAFEEILLWQDTDSDGVSTEDELSTLNDHGITAISLDVEAVNDNLAGNRIDTIGSFQKVNGTTATFAEVTFALDGAAPTFTLAGVISTGTSAATMVAEEPAYFAVDANTGSVEEEPVVEEAAEAVEEEEAIEDTAEASEGVIDEDNRSDEDNDNEESSEDPSEDTGEAEDAAEASDTTDESEAPTDESIETAATETEEDTAVSEPTEAETETTADVETADTSPSTADAVMVEEDVTTAAAESPSESSVVPLIEVEASDQEAAELSTEPADYSVYPTAEGAEIAAATDELALAA